MHGILVHHMLSGAGDPFAVQLDAFVFQVKSLDRMPDMPENLLVAVCRANQLADIRRILWNPCRVYISSNPDCH